MSDGSSHRERTPVASPAPDCATVLVIDDDAEIRRVMTLALSRSYRVLEAENGADGVEMVRRHRPDLVITDILMPRKEGIETIREIQDLAPTTKIIAMSGGGRAHNMMLLDIARAFGVDAVLAKPFAMAGLMAAVDRLAREPQH